MMRQSPARPNGRKGILSRRTMALGAAGLVTIATAGVAEAHSHGAWGTGSDGGSAQYPVSAAGYSYAKAGKKLGYYQADWGGYSASNGWNNEHGTGHTYGTWNGYQLYVPGAMMPPATTRMRGTLVAQGVLDFVCVAGTFVQTGPAQKLFTTRGQVAGIHFAATSVTAAAAANPAAAGTAAMAAAGTAAGIAAGQALQNPAAAVAMPAAAAAMAAAAAAPPAAAPAYGAAAAAAATAATPMLAAPIGRSEEHTSELQSRG